MDVLGSLERFGLSKKEARVYVASLELGDSPASEIALKSRLPRTLVYDILERLIGRGLVSHARKGKNRHFCAADPDELLALLSERERAVREALPALLSLQRERAPPRPKVDVFEGKDGMKTVMNDILRSGHKLFRAYGSSKSSQEILPAFIADWQGRRVKAGVRERVIYNDTPAARRKVKKNLKYMEGVSYKFMPIALESPAPIIVYGNKVVLQLWTREPFSVVIENAQLAETQVRYFEQLWKIAKG